MVLLAVWLLAVGLGCAWIGLLARARRRIPSASTKRDLIAIGASALLTSFLAVPIQHREPVSVGHQIVLWLPVWIVLAAVIRLVALLATTLKSRAR